MGTSSEKEGLPDGSATNYVICVGDGGTDGRQKAELEVAE